MNSCGFQSRCILLLNIVLHTPYLFPSFQKVERGAIFPLRINMESEMLIQTNNFSARANARQGDKGCTVPELAHLEAWLGLAARQGAPRAEHVELLEENINQTVVDMLAQGIDTVRTPVPPGFPNHVPPAPAPPPQAPQVQQVPQQAQPLAFQAPPQPPPAQLHAYQVQQPPHPVQPHPQDAPHANAAEQFLQHELSLLPPGNSFASGVNVFLPGFLHASEYERNRAFHFATKKDKDRVVQHLIFAGKDRGIRSNLSEATASKILMLEYVSLDNLKQDPPQLNDPMINQRAYQSLMSRYVALVSIAYPQMAARIQQFTTSFEVDVETYDWVDAAPHEKIIRGELHQQVFTKNFALNHHSLSRLFQRMSASLELSKSQEKSSRKRVRDERAEPTDRSKDDTGDKPLTTERNEMEVGM
jgi:hypothetical protein